MSAWRYVATVALGRGATVLTSLHRHASVYRKLCRPRPLTTLQPFTVLPQLQRFGLESSLGRSPRTSCSTSSLPGFIFFFFSSRRRHTRLQGDWNSTCALPI